MSEDDFCFLTSIDSLPLVIINPIFFSVINRARKSYKLDRHSVTGAFFYHAAKGLYYGKSFFKKILIFTCTEPKNF